MKHKSDAALKSLCAEVRPDDGIAPHVIKRQQQKRRQRNQHGDHRMRQYGKAARRSLEGTLAGLVSSEAAGDLSIASVEPLAGGRVLLVLVSQPSATAQEIATLESHLQQSAGLFRAALAADIRRKRVPHLRFRVIPAIA